MKKNICKLIVEINPKTQPKRGSLKVSCKQAHNYVNKILVDQAQYNKPTSMDQFINSEMNTYQILPPESQEYVQRQKKFEQDVNLKKQKIITLQHRLDHLEVYFTYLGLQEFMCALRIANPKQVRDCRGKLKKLENNLSFSLEEEEFEPHLKNSIEQFLNQISEVINKSSKIY